MTIPRILVGLDFDGTLHNPHTQPAVADSFFSFLPRLQEHKGAWAIVTGRSLDYLLEGLEECRLSPLPDFIITREREIHQRNGNDSWQGFNDWNSRCQSEHLELLTRSSSILDTIALWLNDHTSARFIRVDDEPAGIVASSEEEMETICTFIDSQLHAWPNLSYARNSIYLRFAHKEFNKGSSFNHLASSLGIPTRHRAAIGDNFNDLSMLNPQSAGFFGTVANAVHPVREHTRRSGGKVADQSHADGVVELLDHFLANLPGT